MANLRGLSLAVVVWSGLLLGISCWGRTHSAVRDLRTTFFVEEWGAPWTPYLRVEAAHKGFLELWYREKTSGPLKGPYVVDIPPSEEGNLFQALGNFMCESRQVIEEPPADWRRLRVVCEMPDRRIEVVLKGNPSERQLAAIKKLNRWLPEPFRFDETVALFNVARP